MHNRITLIGTTLTEPEFIYDPAGNKAVTMSPSVPPHPDAPPTPWGLVFDMRAPGAPDDWPTGDDAFLVVCRDSALVERVLQSVHPGDLLYVEGRLVLTQMSLRTGGDVVPLAEILASEVLVLKVTTETR